MSHVSDIVAGALDQSTVPCITCSFQAEDVVLVDLIRQLRPSIPVLFL